ncbi:MAG: ABC transporter permease [Clostridiales bacterium]|nr:ABC transporter permease [Clostridiales bacterium]
MEISVKRVFKNFKKYRYLLFELTKKNIKLKYRRSYLGILWTLLEPILTTLVLTIVFLGFRGKKDASFPVYILTGRLLYSFFSESTKQAMKSIRSNSGMIKKVYVPKYIYPLSNVLSSYITFLISMVVLFGAMIVFKIYPTIYIFNAILPMLQLLILSLGMGLILATLAVFFRDMEYLWSVVLMMIMYTSAIFYDAGKVPAQWIFNYNPIYHIIVNFRNSVFGSPLDVQALQISTIYSIASLLLGIIVFYRKQDKFILNI